MPQQNPFRSPHDFRLRRNTSDNCSLTPIVPLQRLFVLVAIFFISANSSADNRRNHVVHLKELQTFEAPFVVNRLAWHPEGRKVAIAQNLNRKVMEWDTDTGKRIRTIETEAGGVSALAYTSDGKHLVVGRNFSRLAKGHVHIHIYESPTGELARGIVGPAAPKGDSSDVHALALSPDSRYIAVDRFGGRGNGAVSELASGKVVGRFGDSTGLIYALAFSPDGRTLAVGRSYRKDCWKVGPADKSLYRCSSTGSIDLLSVGEWKLVHQIKIPSPNIISYMTSSVAFSPNSQTLAATVTPSSTGSLDERTNEWVKPAPIDPIKIWDVATGKPVSSFASSHLGPIRLVQYSTDGTLLFAGGATKHIEVWSLIDHRKQAVLEVRSDVVDFALDPKNMRLASAVGKTVKVWRVVH